MADGSNPQRTIAFSPPDIDEQDIEAVAEAMRSGWITTGPRTKQFERQLRDFTQAGGFACFNSATAALECALRALGIGPGDQVITTAYTYTASASPIIHVGATPVLCDTAEDSFEMDYDRLAAAVTPQTKAVIPVDLGGRPCNYDALYAALDSVKQLWAPSNAVQEGFDRCIVVADGAHSLGARYKGQPTGSVADFTTFSFHAVKNLTTGEGGGLAWRTLRGAYSDDDLYHDLMLMSLHGQSKDALAKSQVGSWEYDVAYPGWKCNMTDMTAALGISQLRRYPQLLKRRAAMVARYKQGLIGAGAHDEGNPDAPVRLMRHFDGEALSSGHLMITQVPGATRAQRDAVIVELARNGISANVHYKPLPLLSAYRDLGFDPIDYPHAMAQFENEITLPLHTLLSDDDIDYVCRCYLQAIHTVLGK